MPERGILYQRSGTLSKNKNWQKGGCVLKRDPSDLFHSRIKIFTFLNPFWEFFSHYDMVYFFKYTLQTFFIILRNTV